MNQVYLGLINEYLILGILGVTTQFKHFLTLFAAQALICVLQVLDPATEGHPAHPIMGLRPLNWLQLEHLIVISISMMLVSVTLVAATPASVLVSLILVFQIVELTDLLHLGHVLVTVGANV